MTASAKGVYQIKCYYVQSIKSVLINVYYMYWSDVDIVRGEKCFLNILDGFSL